MAEQAHGGELEMVLRLAFVAEFRDPDTVHHLRRIGLLAEALAERLGLPAEEIRALAVAAPLHDIGKVAIPDEIILKPGVLTADERLVMQSHTVVGARLLEEAESPTLQLAELICRTHHERWDGSGYPDGLTGDAIPLPGRIVALADVYDALVTKRVYKPAATPEQALVILHAEGPAHFDPQVLAAFFAAEERVADIYAEYGEEETQWVV
ncbi:MAG: HD domain-containing protein [Armatimonadetes bacterium]|nr:HD domain-containing protein [Armatimonadota bacterium]